MTSATAPQMGRAAWRTLRAALLIALSMPSVAQGQDAESALEAAIIGGARGLSGTRGFVLDEAAVRASGARTLADLLAGRVLGLSVTYTTGAAGLAPEVSARGAAGLGVGRPMLYVDGLPVRDDAHWFGPSPEGHVPAHEWSLPIEEIATVEVLLGPSARPLLEYGAARGVVLVRTRRPIRDGTAIHAFADAQVAGAGAGFPEVTRTYASAGGSSGLVRCPLFRQVTSLCAPVADLVHRPFAGASPFVRDVGMRAGASATGGLPIGAFRTSAIGERGAASLPGSGIDRVDLALSLAPQFRNGLSMAVEGRTAQVEGAYPAWGANGIRQMGYAAPDPTEASASAITTIADSLLARAFPFTTTRTAFGVAGAWDATPGLLFLGRMNTERLTRDGSLRESYYVPPNEELGGFVHTRRDFARTATGGSLAARTSRSLGAERAVRFEVGHHRSVTDQTAGFVQEAHALDGGFASGETRVRMETRMNATYTAFRVLDGDLRSVGVGLRWDRASFGAARTRAAALKSTDFEWAISDETFFPAVPGLRSLRLHAAYAEAADARPLMELPAHVPASAAVPARFERSQEREAGMRAGVLGDRVELRVTAFGRSVTDGYLLVNTLVGVLPAAGNGWTTGGAEYGLELRALPVGGGTLRGWLWASRARSVYGRLAVPPSLLQIGVGGMTRVETGAPVGNVSTLGYTWSDINGDGIIAASEIAFEAAPTDRGVLHPTTVIGTGGEYGRGRWSVGLAVDAKRGHVRVGGTETLRCTALSCAALYDIDRPLDEQARAVVAAFSPLITGPVHDGSFLRVRDLWFRWRVPSAWTPALGEAVLTIAGQNLLTWSRLPEGDPETGAYLFPTVSTGDLFTQPVLRTVRVRLELMTR